MAVEPLVSDSLTNVSTPRRTNCKEMAGKDAVAFEKTPKSIYCGNSRTCFIFAFSHTCILLHLLNIL